MGDRFKQALHALKIHDALAIIFVILGLLFGGLFVFKIPLLWGSDETFHIMRVYQLSQGKISATYLGSTRREGGYGGDIPGGLYGLVLNVNHDQFNNDIAKVPYGTKNVDDPTIYKTIGKIGINDGPPVTYAFPNTAAYSPVAYTPMLAGMIVAKHFNFSIQHSIILMRLAGLFAYILLVYIALRVLAKSNFKWIIFTVALLPMAVFQSAIISVDSWTLATVILFVSLLVKAVMNRDKVGLTKAELSLLVICAAMLPLIKPGYIFLAPLLLVVPLGRKDLLSRTRLVIFGTLTTTFVLFVVWTLLTKDIASTVQLIKPGDGREAINVAGQISNISQHPFSYLETIARNSILNDGRYTTELVGVLGFNIVPVPGVVVMLEVLVAFLAIAITKSKQMVKIGWCFIGATLAAWLLIITTLYLTYSAVAAPEISGIQGRYFLPLLPVFLVGIVMIANGHFSIVRTPLNLVYGKVTIVALVGVCLVLTALKYIYVTGG